MMMRLWISMWGLAVICLGSSCTPTSIQCTDEVLCGFGEVCIKSQCVATLCATSAQCPIEHYCTDRECVQGCEVTADCYPGDWCNESGVCELGECENSHIDCGFREFCNAATGDCYDAGGQYCNPCNEDYECGEGNYCYAHYCGVNCTTNECPSGFECYPFSDDNDNIVAYQCIAFCWLYEDDFGGVNVSAPAETPLIPLPIVVNQEAQTHD
jgi:hypothetical protein